MQYHQHKDVVHFYGMDLPKNNQYNTDNWKMLYFGLDQVKILLESFNNLKTKNSSYAFDTGWFIKNGKSGIRMLLVSDIQGVES